MAYLSLAEQRASAQGSFGTKENISSYRKEAARLANAGNLRGAIALYDRIIALEPANADALLQRSICHNNAGHVQSCLEEAEAVLKMDANLAIAWILAGECRRLTGKFDEALQAFNQALSLSSAIPIAYCFRAATLNDLGRWYEAAADWQIASSFGKFDAMHNFKASKTYLMLDRFEEAIVYASQAIAHKPNMPIIAQAYVVRGWPC